MGKTHRHPLTFNDEALIVPQARQLAALWESRETPGNPFVGMRETELDIIPDRWRELRAADREFRIAHLFHFYAWANRFGKTVREISRRTKKLVADPYTEWIIVPHPRGESTHARLEAERYLKQIVPFADTEERIEGFWENRNQIRFQYGNDPRRIFAGIPIGTDRESIWAAREEVISRLISFHGVQEKIASLYALWFQEYPWEQRGEFDYFWEQFRSVPFVPVDIWICRLVRMFDWVTGYTSDRRDHVAPQISAFFSRLCLSYDISHIALSQALWHIGARIHSARPEGEPARRTHCLVQCPAFPFCVRDVLPVGDRKKLRQVGWVEYTVAHAANLFNPDHVDVALPSKNGHKSHTNLLAKPRKTIRSQGGITPPGQILLIDDHL